MLSTQCNAVGLIGVTCAQENCTRNLYKFLAPNGMQLYSAQETCVHMVKFVRFDWLAVFSAGIVCIIFNTNHVCCAVSCTSFLYKILEHVSGCEDERHFSVCQSVDADIW